MAVSHERRDWIAQLARGWQPELTDEELETLADEEVDDYYERPLREFFVSVTDPEELHIFADCYPGYHMLSRGIGIELLAEVVCHPLCDLGTALLVYWRAQKWDPAQEMPEMLPDAFKESEAFQRLVERDRENRARVSDFLRHIEQRVLRQEFRTASQLFNPRNDGGEDLTAHVDDREHDGGSPPAFMVRTVVAATS